MKLIKSTLLAKLNALIACVALIIFIVAFATNYWLEQDFNFPVDKGGIPTIPVQASIGLFTACSEEFYPNNKTSEKCSPEGVSDWQYICAGLSLVELVLTVLGVLLAALAIVIQKMSNNFKVKLSIVTCWFITCGFSVGPMVMYPINKRIQVRPNLGPFQVDFDLGWSYKVAAVSSVLFAILVLLNIADIIWSHNSDKIEINKKEDRQTLSQDLNSVSWRY